MLQAGKLDQRIVLRAPQTTRGASGGMKTAWTDFPPIWASVRHLSGNEQRLTSQGGAAAVARTEITIPYRADVTEQWSVIHRGKRYNIQHVNDLMGRRERLILTCDTGANDG